MIMSVVIVSKVTLTVQLLREELRGGKASTRAYYGAFLKRSSLIARAWSENDSNSG